MEKKIYFNTSHVTVYLYVGRNFTFYFRDFNTSHVTVYRKTRQMNLLTVIYFNTSHVTVYLRYNKKFKRRTLISIHPMLRFIGNLMFITYRSSSISIHPMLRFIAFALNKSIGIVEFQYIPCYGLSKGKGSNPYPLMRFQYIPCYGLSNDFKPFLSWHLSSFPLFYVISAFFTSRL